MQLKEVNTLNDINDIIEKSHTKLQVVFKHSTACPISRMAFEKLKTQYPLQEGEADVYYIGVIEQRPLSNYIAEKTGIQHESPQLLAIRNGEIKYTESHLMIDPRILLSLVNGN